MPKLSFVANAIHEMNERKRRCNNGDSGAGVTKYEMNDEAGGGNENKRCKIECDNYSRADDGKEKTNVKDSVKDDDDKPASEESTWDYVETNIHEILTKDLWRTNLKERNIHNCIIKLRDLCLVIDGCYKPIESSREIFFKLGGPLLLIGIMNKYKKNMILTLDCIAIVAVLSDGHPGLVRHCVYAGIIDCVVDIMSRYWGHEILQKYCIGAINVFANADYKASKQLVIGTVTAITTNDGSGTNTGLKAVIHAMKTFPECATLQYACCQHLHYISYEDLAERIIDAGAIGVLAAAMDFSSDVAFEGPIIKKLALETIKKLV